MRNLKIGGAILRQHFVAMAFLGINGNHTLDKGEQAGEYANNPFALTQNTSDVNIILTMPPSMARRFARACANANRNSP